MPIKAKDRKTTLVMLGCRVTPQIKDRLDTAASRNGRSQSQELEYRLEESLGADADADFAVFERWLIVALRQGLRRGAKARGIERRKRSSWLEDRDAYEIACWRVFDYLAMAHPDKRVIEKYMAPWKSKGPDAMRVFFQQLVARGQGDTPEKVAEDAK